MMQGLENRSVIPAIGATVAMLNGAADNAACIMAYHKIGMLLVDAAVHTAPSVTLFKTVAHGLHTEYPQSTPLNVPALRAMYKFAKEYSAADIIEKKLDQIPWSHHVVLLNTVPDAEARAFYVQSILKYRWSRALLVRQIQANLYERHARVVTNFSATLPRSYAQQATMVFKQAYRFSVPQQVTTERDIEEALVTGIGDMLKELGPGFAFIGRQYHIHTTGDDCYIDLLMYHVTLRCYVAIELKNGPFKPEYGGKMHYYLQAVDGALKTTHDNQTIGLILCRSSSPAALATLYDAGKPLVLAEYHLQVAMEKHEKKSSPVSSSVSWYWWGMRMIACGVIIGMIALGIVQIAYQSMKRCT